VAHSRSEPFVKRAVDLGFSLLGLTIALMPMLIIGLLIKLESKGPALFRQTRPGLKGRPFCLVKFRTMRESRVGEFPGISDEARLTKLGRRLRGWSLDELPELWNVLKGDMSLVGPRPLLMEYLSLYSPNQAQRHEVCPGITGWAQINGRNAIRWEEKFDLDLWYIKHRSLKVDLKILWMTAVRVIHREGISQPGHATMERFQGTIGKSQRKA
jgi:lipopolysaccharide/colanic/teichoic acid biosynthesis glycosyltransferase